VVIPIFPLNVVLYPRMPLPLHIFEEKYKEMIQECLDLKQPFGLFSLIKATFTPLEPWPGLRMFCKRWKTAA
jgi:Lon protease-like protein